MMGCTAPVEDHARTSKVSATNAQRWDWLEQRWWATRRDLALIEVRLKHLANRQQQAKTAVALAGQLAASAALARRNAFLCGDMARFNRATAAMNKALTREAEAQALAGSLRPEIRAALDQKSALEEQASAWEDRCWSHAGRWFLELWGTGLVGTLPAEDLLACYGAFARRIREQLDAELNVFTKTVAVMTRSP
jgi:hypothetical protein